MNEVDKLIADAEAIMGGDDARIDLLITRMADIASEAADTINAALLDAGAVKAQSGISTITGLAWLVGRLAAFADHQSGNTRAASISTVNLMVQGGYDEWVETKTP